MDFGGLSRRSLLDQPDHSLHVVKKIGEADLHPGSGYTDGADEQAHRAFLPREDVLDRRTDRRFTGIGVSGMAWHRRAFRLLVM